MASPSSPPPFPPKDKEGTPKKIEKAPIMRALQGHRPGQEIYELEMGTEPPPPTRRVPEHEARAAATPTIPAKPARPSDPRAISTVPPPALDELPEEDGWRLGVPGPAVGSDTALDAAESVDTRLKPPETSRRSFEFALDLELGDGGDPLNEALDLVGRSEPSGSSESISVPPAPAANPLSELREKYALGDFSGALVIAEQLLKTDPNNTDAQRYAESCRDVLKQMYAARLGPLDQVPVVAVGGEQLKWLTLDHRAGFLLSHVDGVSTLEEILDVSGMPVLDAMRIITELIAQKVIVLE
jgi:hypothetical protein